MTSTQPPPTQERVLSTMNPDGSRRWLRPHLSRGRFFVARRVVAYLLMVVFTVTPFLRINGKPVLLLDVANRQFTILGTTFLPTDTLLLALMIVTIFLGIFLITALFGRVWCGWACPQTVYMEFLYRPIERLFEGKRYRTGQPIPAWRRIARYAVYLVISFYLANTFLAYFVGVETLGQWIRSSPFEQPTAFMVMAVVTAMMMVDFCYAREQVCTLMCPYGRFQSVLLDRNSMIISYDEERGEPRGKLQKEVPAGEEAHGDCIDCVMCVRTCPTGIDIREGLQLECVGCAQCIDACDNIMDKINKPRGLIRYSSQEAMATGKRRVLRPRVVIYPVLLMVLVTAFVGVLGARSSVDVAFLRIRATPYQLLDDGRVSNHVLVKVTNRTSEERSYDFSLPAGVAGELSCEACPITVGPVESKELSLSFVSGRDIFERGRAELPLRVTDDRGAVKEVRTHVLGPLFSSEAPVEESK